MVAETLSRLTGVQVDAVRLLLMVLASYPVSVFYKLFLHRTTTPTIKSIYLFATGFSLLFLCYGHNCVHSIINCLFCYLCCKCLPIRIGLTCNFVFTLVYLLVGYRLNQLDWTYSVTWTMPQCVMTLRLIAFSFDIYDGRNIVKEDVGSSTHVESALPTIPSLHHFLGHCFFPGSLVVGPLIPYLTYERFLNDSKSDHEQSLSLSAQRFMGGILVTVVYVLGSLYWPITILQGQEFLEASFWWKITVTAIVTKFYLYKYILVWMLAESSCIATGITHQGTRYHEYCNINFILFETASSFSTIIKAFNVTTNRFSYKYIYRRLKFMGNAYISQSVTLIFLAVWHGLETGYYVAFSNEFLQIYFEKHISLWWSPRASQSRYSGLLSWLLGKLFVFYLMGYDFVPFMFLYYQLWWPIMQSMYFYGHISLGLFFLITTALRFAGQKDKSSEKSA